MVDVNQGGSAAAAWWQHRNRSITELTDSMLQPRAGYTHTLDTGFKLVESGLLREKNVDVLFAALNENLNV